MEKSGLIILICLLLFACTKEEANFVKAFDMPIKSVNCSNDSIHRLGDTLYVVQEKSLNAVGYNKPARAKIFKNSKGDFFIFNTVKEEKTYKQLILWICPEDTTVIKPFVIKWSAFEKSFSSINHEFSYVISCFATPNENYPFTYSDVLTVTIDEGITYYHNGFKYVIDKRLNKTANNDHLKFNIVKEIDGIIFKDVFENTKKESTVYFNIEFGFLGYKNNKTRDRLTLVP